MRVTVRAMRVIRVMQATVFFFIKLRMLLLILTAATTDQITVQI